MNGGSVNAISYILALAVAAPAATVIVGSNRPIKTIPLGINVMLPLREDLYVYVEEPMLTYANPQDISAQPNWNGFKVIVTGIKNAPEITVYSGSDAVYEFNGAFLDLAYENINGPLGEEGRMVGSEMYFYVKDHLGSTRMTIDKNGAIIEATTYQSMGGISSLVSGSQPTREKFTGKEHDNEGSDGASAGMNLDYFGARYYDSDLGMWISPDPMGQYHSPYSYAGGDPVNLVDEDGNWADVVNGEGTVVANVDPTFFDGMDAAVLDDPEFKLGSITQENLSHIVSHGFDANAFNLTEGGSRLYGFDPWAARLIAYGAGAAASAKHFKNVAVKGKDLVKNTAIDGPGGGGRVFQLRYPKKGKPLAMFRLDYFPVKHGRPARLHFHCCTPANEKNHYMIDPRSMLDKK